MKNRNVLLSTIEYSIISLLIALIAYLANSWIFSSHQYLRTRFSPTDALLIEGLVFALLGFLLLLGRGGISLWSLRTAILSATAEAVYGEETVGPSETFKKDRWKPKGFPRLGLIMMLTGIFMILIYFLTL